MASPKLEPLVLSAQERQVLEGWARRRKTSQALALRSRIVLACAGGARSRRWPLTWVSRGTRVRKWRSRFRWPGWKAWVMSRGPVRRGRSPMSRSSW